MEKTPKRGAFCVCMSERTYVCVCLKWIKARFPFKQMRSNALLTEQTKSNFSHIKEPFQFECLGLLFIHQEDNAFHLQFTNVYPDKRSRMFSIPLKRANTFQKHFILQRFFFHFACVLYMHVYMCMILHDQVSQTVFCLIWPCECSCSMMECKTWMFFYF